MIQVIISPRTAELAELARTGLPEDTAMISIENYEQGQKSIVFPQTRVLKLCFNDTEASDRPDAMAQVQADAIRDFVGRHQSAIECLIVCCDAGMSRSPAVAAAILCGLGESDGYIWKSAEYRPNMHCYNLVLRAFGKHTRFSQLKRRTNEKAFRSVQRQNNKKNRRR